MWKKLTLSFLALSFIAAANLRLCCSVTVDGQELDGLYSPFTVDRGERAALAAAEEILEGPARLPQAERSWRLSLRPASGQTPQLSAALLEATAGVELAQGVYVDGVYLGSVSDRAELQNELKQFILGQLPTWAETGYLSQGLDFREQFGRSGSTTPVEDMVLLCSGMAPVLYSDGKGYVARA